MKKKSIQTLTVGLFVFLFLMYATQIGTVPVAAKKAGTITVTTGDDELVEGTPIILNASLIEGIEPATAIVMDGDTELPTQYDEDLNELVFQLPDAIEANGTATFDITGEESGSDNDQTASIKIGQGDYDATYDDWLPTWATTTFMNGTTECNMVKAIGDVIWVETDWGVLCLAVEADWRQGTWRHVVMKDSEWDAVGTHNWNACANWQFQWAASLFQDADEGWQHGAPADTVTIKEVGPVRAVIQTVANSDYKDLLAQSVQNCNATRTYTIYDGFVGIAQHFTLTGDNATQAMTDFTALNDLEEPLRMKHQLMDGRFNEMGANNLSTIHVPGKSPDFARGGGAVDMTDATDPYFAVYEDDGHGYVYNYADMENLEKFDPGNEIVMNYAFDAFPEEGLHRYYIPFNSYTGSFADHAAALNTMWTAEYGTEFEAAAAAPGFELFLSTVVLIGAAIVIRKRRQ
ncbi:MAG: hypothetical protein ACFFDT_31240 [Candidatus Hodarchaeota archaeon]